MNNIRREKKKKPIAKFQTFDDIDNINLSRNKYETGSKIS